MEKIHQLYYQFIWARNQEKKGMTLVFSINLAIPKNKEVGDSKIFSFSLKPWQPRMFGILVREMSNGNKS
jgi:hypothetical protein